MKEFELIAELFRPLAKNFPAAHSLTDDAAELIPPSGMRVIITKDMLNAGVHFFGHENASLIARKALRTNLSDLAAKGAKPWCYFLALALPQPLDTAWLRAFTQGLAQDQAEYDIHLAGGDTTSGASLSISITALGLAPSMLTRSGAKAGDAIYISGHLGLSASGLAMLKENPQAQHPHVERYLLPQPRVKLGQWLQGRATACMDISDGLAQDLHHLCRASGVGVRVEYIPQRGITIEQAIHGGDDYELLFTLPPSMQPPDGCINIGAIIEAPDVLWMQDGAWIPLPSKGYQHF